MTTTLPASPERDASVSDAELLAQITGGHIEAFEQLYERYYARAYRVARSVCRDDGRSEEAVQDAFVAIWRRPGAYDADRGGVANWLLGIARYRAIDAVRRDVRHSSKRAEEDKLDILQRGDDMAERLVARDDADRLNEQIRTLPDTQQEVIALAFYGQLTHTEIAAHLRLAPGTVKGRMRLGLQKLRAGAHQAGTAARSRAELTRALYEGEAKRAGHIVLDATEHMAVASMLDDVLAPALHSIGALWEHREITVADEHLATAICHRLLAQVAAELTVAPAKTRAKILLLSPPSERHTFGLLMAHNVLYGAGYDALMIGGDMPEADLRAALRRHGPAVVGLSATMSGDDAFPDTAQMIHETLPDAHILTGGAAADEIPGHIPALFVERLDNLLESVQACLAPEHFRTVE